MNIFILDRDPRLAAQYHCDKHVVKMILESAQMLSTVAGVGYKPTHVNHPCTKWVRESYGNALWLFKLTMYLNEEYCKRYGGEFHKSCDVASRAFAQIMRQRDGMPRGLTPFALAMPDEYKCDDPVQAYRDFYKGDKAHFAKWRNGAPDWW